MHKLECGEILDGCPSMRKMSVDGLGLARQYLFRLNTLKFSVGTPLDRYPSRGEVLTVLDLTHQHLSWCTSFTVEFLDRLDDCPSRSKSAVNLHVWCWPVAKPRFWSAWNQAAGGPCRRLIIYPYAGLVLIAACTCAYLVCWRSVELVVSRTLAWHGIALPNPLPAFAL